MPSVVGCMPPSRKLFLVFQLVGTTLCAFAINGIGVNAMQSVVAAKSIGPQLHSAKAAGQVLARIREQQIIVYSHAMAKDPAAAANAGYRFALNVAELDREFEAYAALGGSEHANEVSRLGAVVDELDRMGSAALTLRDRRSDELRFVGSVVAKTSNEAVQVADEISAISLRRADAARLLGDAHASTAKQIALAAALLALGAVAGLWRWLRLPAARSPYRPDTQNLAGHEVGIKASVVGLQIRASDGAATRLSSRPGGLQRQIRPVLAAT